MSLALFLSGATVAVAAALRSTWSPCGWSMLSTITPLTERGRGHRFGATATWFVGGALLGGLLLGTVGAIAGQVVAELELSATTRAVVAVVVVFVAAAFDARLLKPALPHYRRQVNEDWLDEFRPWVYASGFGLQIGAGLATYIMTGGVYAVVCLAALTAQPGDAWLLGAVFGLSRGVAVLSGRGNVDARRLASFHRRFARIEEPVRRIVTATLVATGLGLGTVALGAPGPTVLVGAAVLAAGCGVVASSERGRDGSAQVAGATETEDNASLRSGSRTARRVKEPTTA